MNPTSPHILMMTDGQGCQTYKLERAALLQTSRCDSTKKGEINYRQVIEPLSTNARTITRLSTHFVCVYVPVLSLPRALVVVFQWSLEGSKRFLHFLGDSTCLQSLILVYSSAPAKLRSIIFLEQTVRIFLRKLVGGRRT